ncbi:MAG: phosphatase [Flammeovirgaceae bacterium]|nr:phosphatase [Flammeovirgaceae bacterium]
MKLAAVDIGSNAIRFQVTTVLQRAPKAIFKKLEYVRFPLRLGHDVFTTNRISDSSKAKFIKLMRTYKLLIELYEVNDYMFCATSAMRESENGEELVEEVYRELGIKINIIDGKREAEFINKAIVSYLGVENYLHIDVGGGSTELNLYSAGKKIKTQSFKVGSVRVLEHHDLPVMWADMEDWVRKNVRSKYSNVISVGTGGNISKIFELAKRKAGQVISLKKVKNIKEMVNALSIEQRIFDLQMNPDRADVIIPASNIYIKVMEWSKSKKIMVPEVGLKDGILMHLFEKNLKQKRIEF